VVYITLLISADFLKIQLIWRLYGVIDRMIIECGAAIGIKIGKGNRSTQRKPAPIPHSP
jgi:hypothetical protein